MKRFLRKVLVFGLSAALLVTWLTYKRQLSLFRELQTLKRALEYDNAVIVLGSSVEHSVAAGEPDRRSISEMVGAHVPGMRVFGVSSAAYHPDIYREYVRHIAKSGRKPTVVVPINFRCFAPLWDLMPGYQFIEQKHLLNGRPHIVDWPYRPISEAEFAAAPVYHGDRQIGTMAGYRDGSWRRLGVQGSLRRGFVAYYMQPLTADHRKLKSLLEICKIGNDSDLEIVMYVTPIDFSHAEQLNVEGFIEHQRTTLRTIRSALATVGADVIDLSLSLDSSHFARDTWLSDHLTMAGRAEVARAVATAIKQRRNATGDE